MYQRFDEAVSKALVEYTGYPAFACGTGFGDWKNKLSGIGVIKSDFFADAGMVCVCRLTPKMLKLWKEKYGADWTEDDVEKLYSLFEEKLLGILDQFSEVKPYVLETIEELRKKDIKIGSTTGYTDKMMAIVTAKAKENGYEPDAWFSPDSTGNVGRPYPYMIFRNMEALKIQSVKEKFIDAGTDEVILNMKELTKLL